MTVMIDGMKVRRLRKALGITQIELGAKLGHSQSSTVSRMEASYDSGSLEGAKRVAIALGVPVQEILSEDALEAIYWKPEHGKEAS